MVDVCFPVNTNPTECLQAALNPGKCCSFRYAHEGSGTNSVFLNSSPGFDVLVDNPQRFSRLEFDSEVKRAQTAVRLSVLFSDFVINSIISIGAIAGESKRGTCLFLENNCCSINICTGTILVHTLDVHKLFDEQIVIVI